MPGLSHPVSLGFAHVLSRVSTAFLSKKNIPLYVWTMLVYPSIHPWTLCCCRLLAGVKNAAVNKGGGRISVHGPAFSSYGHVPKSGVAGSYGNSNSNISRTCQTVFHSGCTILHSHQPCTRGSNFSKSCTDTCSFLFFVRIAILMGVRGTSLWF